MFEIVDDRRTDGDDGRTDSKSDLITTGLKGPDKLDCSIRHSFYIRVLSKMPYNCCKSKSERYIFETAHAESCIQLLTKMNIGLHNVSKQMS